MKALRYLLLFLPVAVAAEIFHWGDLLVFISLALGHPMTLEFYHPEVIAMIAAPIIAALVAIDGRSNWLEGAMLPVVYAMLALGFHSLPEMM